MKATLAHLALCDLEETLRHRIICFIGAVLAGFLGLNFLYQYMYKVISTGSESYRHSANVLITIIIVMLLLPLKSVLLNLLLLAHPVGFLDLEK